MMEALILAGGRGTRLQSVVNDRPKPMAVVAGRPFVEWIILHLRAQGIQKITMCTGYKSDFVENYFGNGSKWDLSIRYSDEPEPLGTGGAIRLGMEYVQSEQVLVLNGDSFTDFSVDHLSNFHQMHDGVASLLLVRQLDRTRYGAVEVSRKGEILNFHEKNTSAGSGFVNGGVYLMEKEWLMKIPLNKNFSIEVDIFPELIGKGLWGLATNYQLLDIGTPQSFSQADKFIRDAVSMEVIESVDVLDHH